MSSTSNSANYGVCLHIENMDSTRALNLGMHLHILPEIIKHFGNLNSNAAPTLGITETINHKTTIMHLHLKVMMMTIASLVKESSRRSF